MSRTLARRTRGGVPSFGRGGGNYIHRGLARFLFWAWLLFSYLDQVFLLRSPLFSQRNFLTTCTYVWRNVTESVLHSHVSPHRVALTQFLLPFIFVPTIAKRPEWQDGFIDHCDPGDSAA